MGHYILNFSVYTMAMIGLICFALFVYKKFSLSTMNTKRRGLLKIDDVLSLSPRKTLYVIKAGDEKFLIATDADRTALISKLELNKSINLENELDLIDESNAVAYSH